MRALCRHDRAMRKGSELTLAIDTVAYGGDGIGRHEGCVVFVPYTITGETVRVRVVK